MGMAVHEFQTLDRQIGGYPCPWDAGTIAFRLGL
jgi:hypothetical protein